jgi:type IV secretory pathway VirB10-like protein
MNPANPQPAQSMEGPSGIELHPTPPDPARLSKRAGVLFLVVVCAVFGLIVYGIYERGQQRLGTGPYRQDSRNMTAATDAGKQIASQVPERAINNDRRDSADDQELKPPLQSNAASNGQTAPGNAVGSRGAASYNPQPAQQYHEPTPEERRRAELYQREMAALDAPTRTGGGGDLGQARLANLSAKGGDTADTLALLQTMQAVNGGGLAPVGNTAAAASALPRGLFAGATPAYSPSEEYQLQNMQDQKQAFLAAARKKAIEDYLATTRVAPVNQFVIRAGWDIPAILEQGINSDLPGEIRALVRENVYDTASGQHLLIPQGSRLVGRYSSQVAYGQNGLQVVWDRVIFPDASAIDLSGINGQDATGRSGFRYGVDNHYVRIFGFSLLTSVFTAAAQLSQSHSGSVLAYPSDGEIAASAVGQQMATLGAETTRRNLNIQPTIKIPMGYRFNVRVNHDLAFEGPYQPLRVGGNGAPEGH